MEEIAHQQVAPFKQPLSEQLPNEEKPRDFQKILFFVFILLVIVGIGVGGYLLGTNKNKVSLQTKVVDSQTVTPLPTTTNEKGWKILQNHYGAYQIQYPSSWVENICQGGEGDMSGCTIFSTEKVVDFSPGIVQINVSISQNTNTNSSLNFTIPSISNVPNAMLIKDSQSNTETISFDYRNAHYELKISFSEAKKKNYSEEEADQMLKAMAQSITFLNQESTCDSPSIAPLTDFPSNFTLSNDHLSDETDIITSDWPYATTHQYSGQNSMPVHAKNVVFMITFTKDGESFLASSDFLNTIIPIQPVSASNPQGTDIIHINCVNSETDFINQVYHIGHDSHDLLAVDLYGSALNPTQLWGMQLWNINLLKKTRNTVYIMRSNFLQKYTAQGYYVARQAVYGGKPAIYLYPQKTSQVTVKIQPKGELLKTDSLYNPILSGWKVTANPNGLINNTLPYLYYEAMLQINTPTKGYYVAYNNLFTFVKKYVIDLGLNENEANEFVGFWETKLPVSPYYFVSHLDKDIINSIYPLTINPTPDTLLRVEIYFKPAYTPLSINSPSIPNITKRTGFTAVEWGGILAK